MARIILLSIIACFLLSCNTKSNVEPATAPVSVTLVVINTDAIAASLKDKGYQIWLEETEDTIYILQQYYLVLLKDGPHRDQDSTTTARLQEGHMAHLNRMHEEGYADLIGPMGTNEENARGIVVYNVPTAQVADSLARLDPMVQAGRLKVVTLPWWTAKYGTLR